MLKPCSLLGEEPKARERRRCRGLSREEKLEGHLGQEVAAKVPVSTAGSRSPVPPLGSWEDDTASSQAFSKQKTFYFSYSWTVWISSKAADLQGGNVKSWIPGETLLSLWGNGWSQEHWRWTLTREISSAPLCFDTQSCRVKELVIKNVAEQNTFFQKRPIYKWPFSSTKTTSLWQIFKDDYTEILVF